MEQKKITNNQEAEAIILQKLQQLKNEVDNSDFKGKILIFTVGETVEEMKSLYAKYKNAVLANDNAILKGISNKYTNAYASALNKFSEEIEREIEYVDIAKFFAENFVHVLHRVTESTKIKQK